MEATSIAQRPRAVRLAVGIYWFSAALGMIVLIIFWPGMSPPTADVPTAAKLIVLSVIALAFCFLIFLTLKVLAGRNWARITLLVMFLVFSPQKLNYLVHPLQTPPFLWASNLLGFILEIYVFYLLFTEPGSSWFRKTKTA